MTTLIRIPQIHSLPDGVYRATIASIEPNIPSRYSSRADLLRIAFDLEATDGQTSRLWLTTLPVLNGRLDALIRAALGRILSEEEAQTFNVEELVGKQVGVLITQGVSRSGVRYPRIVTFASPSEVASTQGQLESALVPPEEDE
jgi:hypothetical protein